jgi:hypothetical protein
MLLCGALRRHFRSGGGPANGAFALAALRCLLHAAALAECAAHARLKAVEGAGGGAQDSPLRLQVQRTAGEVGAAAKDAAAVFFTQCPSLPACDAIAALCAPLSGALPGGADGGTAMNPLSPAARTSKWAAGVADHCLARAAALRPPLRALTADALCAIAVDATVMEDGRKLAGAELRELLAGACGGGHGGADGAVVAFLEWAWAAVIAWGVRATGGGGSGNGGEEATGPTTKRRRGEAAGSAAPPAPMAVGAAAGVAPCVRVAAAVEELASAPTAAIPQFARLLLRLTLALLPARPALLRALLEAFAALSRAGAGGGAAPQRVDLKDLILSQAVKEVPAVVAALEAGGEGGGGAAALVAALAPGDASPLPRAAVRMAHAVCEAACDCAVEGAASALGLVGGEEGCAAALRGAPPLSALLAAAGALRVEAPVGEGAGEGALPHPPAGQHPDGDPTLLLPFAPLMDAEALAGAVRGSICGGEPGCARYLVRRALGGGGALLPPALPAEEVFSLLVLAGDGAARRARLPLPLRVALQQEASGVAYEEGVRPYFPDRAINGGLRRVVEAALRSGGALPVLLMRAMLLAATKIPDVRANVAELLLLLVRSLKGAAFEPPATLEGLPALLPGDADAAAPVWMGFVRLTKATVPLSLPVLAELPAAHLGMLLRRERELRARFEKHPAAVPFAALLAQIAAEPQGK